MSLADTQCDPSLSATYPCRYRKKQLQHIADRFVIVTIFLPMKNSIGESWSYLILFVAPVIASVVFLYFKLPETKNKTPIEVDEAAAKLPKIFFLKPRVVADVTSIKL
ncbi:hypothetical protein COOONC_20957 [Cooperia oncophora]